MRISPQFNKKVKQLKNRQQAMENVVNNKQFNTAAPQGGSNKVNNARGFFGTKAGKWVIGGLVTAAIVGGVTVIVKKIRAKKAAAAPADQPANE